MHTSRPFCREKGQNNGKGDIEPFIQNIELNEKEGEGIYRTFQEERWFQIPIDRYVDNQPLDYFDSKEYLYFSSLPELWKMLSINHLPEPYFGRFNNFVSTDMGLF